MKLPLRTTFNVFHAFRYIVLVFFFNANLFIFFLNPVLTYFSFSGELLYFYEFVSILLLISRFNTWCSDRIQSVVSFFYICWDLLCVKGCYKFWRRFHEMLRRKYIISCLSEMFCKYLLIYSDMVPFKISFSMFSFETTHNHSVKVNIWI